MSVNCKGLGPSNAARKTWFYNENEVAPALLHAAKFKIFFELRAESIRNEDVVRVKIFEDNLGMASIVCRFGKYLDQSDHTISHAGMSSQLIRTESYG